MLDVAVALPADSRLTAEAAIPDTNQDCRRSMAAVVAGTVERRRPPKLRLRRRTRRLGPKQRRR